jgi:hypothetical protein
VVLADVSARRSSKANMAGLRRFRLNPALLSYAADGPRRNGLGAVAVVTSGELGSGLTPSRSKAW